MTRSHVAAMASVLFLMILPVGSAAVHGSDESGLVVHEWGTFTSIAGENGEAVEWLPLDTPSDLPCFVEHFGPPKGSLAAKVRMETPVLYFYSPRQTAVDVSVRFKQGLITEWFPHADVTPAAYNSPQWTRPGAAAVARWQNVTVAPKTGSSFLDDRRDSHYYTARRTDASPLVVGSVDEKFLFYRGVAGFEPPISAVVRNDGRIDVSSATSVGDLIVFENHGGAIS